MKSKHGLFESRGRARRRGPPDGRRPLPLTTRLRLEALESRTMLSVTINWAPVGNPGNAADPATGSLYGAVPYAYNIDAYDVTNSQYVEFLNAKDANGANPLGLYNSNMSNATFGGINYNAGNANGNKYSVMSGDGNHPVNFVTWFDAARFANWLNNGQGNGDTESGAYTLLGGTPTPSNGNSITRNAGATVFLPSESEWYKAAYYNPATSSYFQYPTSSNTAPTASGPIGATNSANYNNAVANLTDVGAYIGTTSPYGAFDMGGNVYQWNDALISSSSRRLRGAAFSFNSFFLLSSFPISPTLASESNFLGFRVASIGDALGSVNETWSNLLPGNGQPVFNGNTFSTPGGNTWALQSSPTGPGLNVSLTPGGIRLQEPSVPSNVQEIVLGNTAGPVFQDVVEQTTVTIAALPDATQGAGLIARGNLGAGNGYLLLIVPNTGAALIRVDGQVPTTLASIAMSSLAAGHTYGLRLTINGSDLTGSVYDGDLNGPTLAVLHASDSKYASAGAIGLDALSAANPPGSVDITFGTLAAETLASHPQVALTAPNSGVFHVGDTVHITGTATSSVGIDHVWAQLYKGGTNNGANFLGNIYTGANGSGNLSSVDWLVPSTFNGQPINGGDYLIKWVAFDTLGQASGAYSSQFLSILPPITPGHLAETWANILPGNGQPVFNGGTFSTPSGNAWTLNSLPAGPGLNVSLTPGGIRLQEPSAPSGLQVITLSNTAGPLFQNVVEQTTVTLSSDPVKFATQFTGLIARADPSGLSGYVLVIAPNNPAYTGATLLRLDHGMPHLPPLANIPIPSLALGHTYGLRLVVNGSDIVGSVYDGSPTGPTLAVLRASDTTYATAGGIGLAGAALLSVDASFGALTADALGTAVPAVNGLSATGTGPQSITLRWKPTITDGKFFLERASSPNGVFKQIAILDHAVTSFPDPGPPLTPGTAYYYRLWDMSNNVPSAYSSVVTATTLAAPPVFVSGPHIISPAMQPNNQAADLGTLTAPIDHLDVTFNEPINPDTFTASDIVLKQGTTPVAVSSIEPMAGNTYRIHFAATSATGLYTIIVGPQITDPAGNLMNQNGNQVNGDSTADKFVGTFSVQADATKPVVLLRTPNSGSFRVGDLIRIEANADSPNGISHVWIQLYRGGDGPGNFVGNIFQGTVGSGNRTSFDWVVPATLNGQEIDGTLYKIKWIGFDASPNHVAGADFSDGDLTILGQQHSSDYLYSQARADMLTLAPTKAVGGITVVTHGWQASIGGSGDSLKPLAEAIQQRAGGWLLDYNEGAADTVGVTYVPGSGPTNEVVVLYDWSSESDNLQTAGWGEAAGDALFSLLVGLGLINPIAGASNPPIDFIGHSFGTAVNSEAVERLARFRVPVDQVTMLDPHDFDEGLLFDGPQQLFTLGKPYGYGATVWNNVAFADAYYQDSGILLIPDGRRIPGAFNYWVQHPGGGPNPHSWIWNSFYLDSVNPGAFSDFPFEFNRIGGLVDRPAPIFFGTDSQPQDPAHTPGDLPQDVTNYRAAPVWTADTIFNGNFEFGLADVIPGWTLHGGGGKGLIDGSAENHYLDLDGQSYIRPSATHNWQYVPSSSDKVEFDVRVFNAGSGDDSVVVTLGGLQLGTVSVANATTSFNHFSVPIPEILRGQVGRLTVSLGSTNLTTSSVVLIDNIQFSGRVRSGLGETTGLHSSAGTQTAVPALSTVVAANLVYNQSKYDGSGHVGVASALASASAGPTAALPAIPPGIVNPPSHLDLNHGPIAKYFEHLAHEGTAKAKGIIVEAKQLTDELGLDDELLDSLLVGLRLKIKPVTIRT